MTKRAKRIIGFGVLASFGLVLLSVAAFAALLMRGPIEVSYLNDFAADAISDAFGREGEGVAISIGNSVLAWNSDGGGVDFRAVNVVLVGENGERLFDIPEVTIGVSGWALFSLKLAPSSLKMAGANLRLYRGANGGFELGLGSFSEISTDKPELSLRDIARDVIARGGQGSARYLTSLSILDSQLEYHDPERGLIFTASDVNISFLRDKDGLATTASLNLVAGEQNSRLELTGRLNADDDLIEIVLSFTDLSPSLLGQVEPTLKAFDKLHVPLAGLVRAQVARSASVESIEYEVQGSDGWIDAPDGDLDPLPVAFVELRGRIENNFSLFMIDDFHFNFDGPTANISGLIDTSEDVRKAQIDLEASELSIEEIVKFLPSTDGPSISRWFKEHLISGTLDTLEARLALALPSDGSPAALESMTGRFDFSGVRGRYIKGMDPVSEVDGFGVMADLGIRVQSTHGRFDGTEISIDRSVFEVVDFNAPELRGSLDAHFSGPAGDAFRVIDQPPLSLMSKLNIDPDASSGQVETELHLSIPMRGQVGLPFLQYNSESILSGFVLDDMTFGRPLADGELILTVSREDMTANGTMEYGGIPVTVDWTRLFGTGREFQSRYIFTGRLGAAERKLLGMEFSPYVTGPVEFELTFVKPENGDGQGTASLDLTETGLSLATIDFRKEPGIAGAGSFDFTLAENGQVSVSRLDLAAGGLSATGSMSLNAKDPHFMPMRIVLDRFEHGLTSVSGSLDIEQISQADSAAAGRASPGVKVVLRVQGERLDLRRAVSGVLGVEGGGIGLPMHLVVGDPQPVQEVLISDTATLHNLIAVAEHNGVVWSNVNATGTLSNRSRLRIELEDQGAERLLSLTADDAGDALKAVNWFDTISGGTMRVAAILPNPPTQEPIVGQVTIEDFTLVDAPQMARLLSLVSLKGITEGSAGEIDFDELTMDFEVIGDNIEFPIIRARGALAIQAKGFINRIEKTVDFSGDVAPGTIINSLMGLTSLPIINEIIGDSIIAATFRATGPANDIVITANPLSMLTPGGAPRRIFEFLTGGGTSLPSESGRIPEQQAVQPDP